MLGKYVKNANAIPHIGWRKEPKLYKTFAPILAPYIPNKGAERNAARLAIPKTKPYYQAKNQLSNLVCDNYVLHLDITPYIFSGKSILLYNVMLIAISMRLQYRYTNDERNSTTVHYL